MYGNPPALPLLPHPTSHLLVFLRDCFQEVRCTNGLIRLFVATQFDGDGARFVARAQLVVGIRHDRLGQAAAAVRRPAQLDACEVELDGEEQHRHTRPDEVHAQSHPTHQALVPSRPPALPPARPPALAPSRPPALQFPPSGPCRPGATRSGSCRSRSTKSRRRRRCG